MAPWGGGTTHEVLAPPPKDQSWGPDSIVLRLGPGVMIHQRTGRTDDMRSWSHRPRLSPTRSSTRGTDGSRPPTSATIGGRNPRPRAATRREQDEPCFLWIAEPPNDPHWRAARGCPPEARTTWPSAPWGPSDAERTWSLVPGIHRDRTWPNLGRTCAEARQRRPRASRPACLLVSYRPLAHPRRGSPGSRAPGTGSPQTGSLPN